MKFSFPSLFPFPTQSCSEKGLARCTVRMVRDSFFSPSPPPPPVREKTRAVPQPTLELPFPHSSPPFVSEKPVCRRTNPEYPWKT